MVCASITGNMIRILARLRVVLIEYFVRRGFFVSLLEYEQHIELCGSNVGRWRQVAKRQYSYEVETKTLTQCKA
jgi:hypothetical protein